MFRLLLLRTTWEDPQRGQQVVVLRGYSECECDRVIGVFVREMSPSRECTFLAMWEIYLQVAKSGVNTPHKTDARACNARNVSCPARTPRELTYSKSGFQNASRLGCAG